MKVKFYAIAAIAVSVLALTTNVYTHNTVPQPGRAGDPINNKTCADSSACHSDGSLLDGSSVITLKIGATAGAQVNATPAFIPTPGETYWMTITLDKQGLDTCGFQLTALFAGTNAKADSFIVTDATKTIMNPRNGINYINHRNSHSPNNNGTWLYKWVAPANINGPILFYTVANLSNGNGNKEGDKIYKRVVSINGNGLTSVEDVSPFTNVTLHPNPATENVTINYNLLSNEFVSGQILDVEGKIVKSLFNEKQDMGMQTGSYNISNLTAGKYFIHIKSAGKSTVKPFVKY